MSDQTTPTKEEQVSQHSYDLLNTSPPSLNSPITRK